MTNPLKDIKIENQQNIFSLVEKQDVLYEVKKGDQYKDQIHRT